ncbi:MAG: hypothetical protein D6732_06205 [Methanobacteriota archaeon]|nr:MAG: hypothetical protein D6732_06205 [Euryarchaeota archaeon]
MNRRLANFTVEFGGSQRDQQTGSYAMLEDNTPPKVLRVTIPRYQYAMDRIFNIHVEAVDYESDVIEVQYTVSESPVLSNPDSVNWKSVYARRDFNAMDLKMEHLHKYYVFAKVKNSVGLWSAPVKSNPVLIDTTSPGAPSITFTASLPDAVPGQLPVDAVTDYHNATQEIPFTTRGDKLFQFNVSPTQQPSSGNDESGSSLFPVFTFNIAAAIITPDTIPPGIRVHFDPASDAESGIQQYLYKITGSPTDANPNSGWHVLGVDENGVPKTQLIVVGEPLAYLDTFYVHIRAMNKAGLIGPAVTTTGIRPKDPTKPSTPEINFGDEDYAVLYNSSNSSITVGFRGSRDNETGIKEYQVRIGTTPDGNDILNWSSENIHVYHSLNPLVEITEPENLFNDNGGGIVNYPISQGQNFFGNITLPGGNQPNYGGMNLGGGGISQFLPPNRLIINNLNLPNGITVYVSVRAVNGDGVPSDVAVSGKIVIDNTPPAKPTVTATYDAQAQKLTVNVTNLVDPESKVSNIKVAFKSDNMVQPKRGEAFVSVPVYRSGNAASKTVVFYLVGLIGNHEAGDKIYVKVVSVNQANLKSDITTTIYNPAVNFGGNQIPTTIPTSSGFYQNLGNPYSK